MDTEFCSRPCFKFLTPQSLERAQGLLADGEEATAVVPPVVAPVHGGIADAAVLIEVRHMVITGAADPIPAERKHGELPLDLGVAGPESKKFLELRWTQAIGFEVCEHILDASGLVQVDEQGVDGGHPFHWHTRVLRCDVAVLPVVFGRGHLFEGHPVVDGDAVVDRLTEFTQCLADDTLEATTALLEDRLPLVLVEAEFFEHCLCGISHHLHDLLLLT
jgi:hypothetical protein